MMFVPFPKDLAPVRIIRRRNRFVIEARLDEDGSGPNNESGPNEGSIVQLHIPNSGRMQELLTSDALGLATLDGGGARKTSGTLLVVQYNGRWVSVDARMPNRLFERCLSTGGLAEFRGYESWRAEVPFGQGRIDFMLSSPDQPHFLVETKSSNLVEDGLALFPDAPTERGTRHVMELTDAVKDGLRAAVVWFVQRDDAERLAPHHVADPAFARSIADATKQGVELYAFRCYVDPTGVRVIGQIPVVISPSTSLD